MNILEDGVTVVTAATALNFVEPDLVLVTNAGGGQANVAMDSYLPYVGRPGPISAILSTDDIGVLYGSDDNTKALQFASASDATVPVQVVRNIYGSESIVIGNVNAAALGQFLQFVTVNDVDEVGSGAVFGGLTLNGGIAASTTFFGITANGAIGAFTPSGEADNAIKIIGTGVDSDGNVSTGTGGALLLAVDGPVGSGFVPGQFVVVITDRTGFVFNPFWIRHDGHIGIGQDVGNPEGNVQIQGSDPDVLVEMIQGTVDQVADLTQWAGRIEGEILDFNTDPPLQGETSIFLVDSTAFAPSGIVWLYRNDNMIGADRPVAYSANNTGTGELTLVDPLPRDVVDPRVFQTTQLSLVDAQGVFQLPVFADVTVDVVAPVKGKIAFDDNTGKFVGYDGATWVPLS